MDVKMSNGFSLAALHSVSPQPLKMTVGYTAVIC